MLALNTAAQAANPRIFRLLFFIVFIGSVGLFAAPVNANQTSDQHRQEKLPANSLDDRQTTRDVGARHDIAKAERRQRDEAKIDRAHPGKISGESECARPELL